MTAATSKRILLTDAAVKREPFAEGKPRIIRDTKVAGFHLWVGRRTKTFRYQYEAPRVNGHRGSTNIEWLGEYPHHSAEQARAKTWGYRRDAPAVSRFVTQLHPMHRRRRLRSNRLGSFIGLQSPRKARANERLPTIRTSSSGISNNGTRDR